MQPWQRQALVLCSAPSLAPAPAGTSPPWPRWCALCRPQRGRGRRSHSPCIGSLVVFGSAGIALLYPVEEKDGAAQLGTRHGVVSSLDRPPRRFHLRVEVL